MTDKEVIELVLDWQQNKNQESMNKLYKHVERLFLYFKSVKFRGLCKHIDVDGVFHDCFVRCVNDFDASLGFKFMPYLTNHIRYGVLNERRKNKKYLDHKKEWDDTEYYIKSEKKREYIVSTKELLADLSDRQKKLIVKYYFESKLMGDIGRELGISRQAVSFQIAKILSDLRVKYA